MVDRRLVLKWAHLGLGRDPRYREIIDDQRRARAEHIAEIQAKQETLNISLHEMDHSHIPLLRVAERYAAGKPRDLRYLRTDGE
jgi:hypothetical protein